MLSGFFRLEPFTATQQVILNIHLQVNSLQRFNITPEIMHSSEQRTNHNLRYVWTPTDVCNCTVCVMSKVTQSQAVFSLIYIWLSV
ncbi:hypothetical protein RW98_04336 [Escherichia coli]|nr:hypothetical protein RW98_04336 [Escherichia coli]